VYERVRAEERNSISRGDLARDLIARRHGSASMCPLMNALPMQRHARARAMNAHRVDTGRGVSGASALAREKERERERVRALKADVSRKINYLLVRATTSRLAAFANELAPDARLSQCNACRSCRTCGNAVNRADHPVDISEARCAPT